MSDNTNMETGTQQSAGSYEEPRKSFYSTGSAVARQNEEAAPTPTNQRVKVMRSRLGILDRIKLDHQSKVEARRVLGELVVNLLEKQKQEILFKMGLELSDAKKRAFAESMREGARIEREIAERSTEFEKQLIDVALDHAVRWHESKKARLDQLEAHHAGGLIDDASLASERKAIERWAETFRDNLDAKIEIILRNHAQQIEKALTIFQERAISGRLD